MRREGRQHGIVSVYSDLSSSLSNSTERTIKKSLKRIEGSFMGQFTKAPSKPTNKSKFTGRCKLPRCGLCHAHPVNKAMAKIKGNHRHKDEISDFYLKGDRRRSEETGEVNYDSDGGVGLDDREELICQVDGGGGGGGCCEDEEWVLVEGV
ncbi:uncharacterized protein LOC110018842 [Phalaenopsis equestris]|uniref:uncharacterized protein LOC110018842 n=1 Tax=Phalaenopsis equestris TaxID=78828 RepID=UPI0009E58772|nr:uncharacterized protein LOC110018842 [Phalaenopsis equestris]